MGSPCRCAQAAADGLRSLGHEAVFADSEEIELRAHELARKCDLVIDHTDTYRGRGLFRPLVRLLLEARGARLVGSGAAACMLSDDKASAKARFAEQGIPVPPGIVVGHGEWDLPEWLRPPCVLKPAYEHMSRGLSLAQSEEGIREGVRRMLDRYRQPILVETYIAGREIALSMLDGPGGLEVLPPLEWRLGTSDRAMLTQACKMVEPGPEREDASPAALPAPWMDELKGLAIRAFRALGLRDYARFDIRLTESGNFFFLEANTTPSLEPLEAFPLSARWAGLDYPALIGRMISSALRRGALPDRRGDERLRVDLPTGPVFLRVPEGVHPPPPSSVELAERLDVKAGESVLELGCGSGLLAIAAAKMGAGRVVATDIDPQALDAAVFNARANGVEGRVEVRAGSWYEALGRDERFDVVIATPPQTPGPVPFGPRWGGPDGTRHLAAVVDGAPAFLKSGSGRLWLLAITLAHPDGLWRRLREAFSEVRLVAETERVFEASEYEAMDKGLFDYLLSLRSSGRSKFSDAGDGTFSFRNRFIRASGAVK